MNNKPREIGKIGPQEQVQPQPQAPETVEPTFEIVENVPPEDKQDEALQQVIQPSPEATVKEPNISVEDVKKSEAPRSEIGEANLESPVNTPNQAMRLQDELNEGPQ